MLKSRKNRGISLPKYILPTLVQLPLIKLMLVISFNNGSLSVLNNRIPHKPQNPVGSGEILSWDGNVRLLVVISLEDIANITRVYRWCGQTKWIEEETYKPDWSDRRMPFMAGRMVLPHTHTTIQTQMLVEDRVSYVRQGVHVPVRVISIFTEVISTTCCH